MLGLEQIMVFFGSAAAVWVAGFSWGKGVAWLRELRNAA